MTAAPKFARGDRVHIEGPLNTDGTLDDERGSGWWYVWVDEHSRWVERHESELTLIPPPPTPVTIELGESWQHGSEIIINHRAMPIRVADDGTVYINATRVGTVPR